MDTNDTWICLAIYKPSHEIGLVCVCVCVCTSVWSSGSFIGTLSKNKNIPLTAWVRRRINHLSVTVPRDLLTQNSCMLSQHSNTVRALRAETHSGWDTQTHTHTHTHTHTQHINSQTVYCQTALNYGPAHTHTHTHRELFWLELEMMWSHQTPCT